MKDINIEMLARKIANDLFEIYEESETKVSRIEFKSHKDEDGNERGLGGLCYIALARAIEKTLRNY